MQRRRVRAAIAALLMGVAVPAAIVTGPSARATDVRPAGSVDWTQFQFDDGNSGTTTESLLGAGNAPALGLEWMSNLGGLSLASPTVAYRPTIDRALVYVGNRQGTMGAYDWRTGVRVWAFQTGGPIVSAPALVGDTLYAVSQSHRLVALDADTGKLRCQYVSNGQLLPSPVVADPGDGLTVYVGDSGTGAAPDGGAFIAVNAVDPNPAPDCSLRFRFTGWGAVAGATPETGSWSPPAFSHDDTGRAVLTFGSSSPDNSVYSIDAQTGDRLWRFQTKYNFKDADVGAGVVTSAPGQFGFDHGAAYAIGKSRVLYALDLRTGAKLWEFDIGADDPGGNGSTRTTPALTGDHLLVPAVRGIYGFDPATGTKLWRFDSPGRAEATSIAVSGAAGDQVAFFGDVVGNVYAVSVDTGAMLWRYDTGNIVYSSPAVSGGRVFIAGASGYLYSFAPDAAITDRPIATITAPGRGELLAPDTTSVSLQGTATSTVGVASVQVALRDAKSGRYWDAVTKKWLLTFTERPAHLTPTPGGVDWDVTVPVLIGPRSFVVQARAIDAEGQWSAPVDSSTFDLSGGANPPQTVITSPKKEQTYQLPDPPVEMTLQVVGTASDTSGSQPGIATVKVVIRNVEHNEWFCGTPGCGGSKPGSGPEWTTKFAAVDAILADPGAPSTSWTLPWVTLDHPHNYRISAYAIDVDNTADPSPAANGLTCVRSAGTTTCWN